jgi:hypothetical protein
MSRSPQISIGAPVAGDPTQRDLPAEVEAIREWLETHPAITANALSVAAGLGRNSLTSLLRETDPEKPTARRLDKLHDVLSQYGYLPQGQPPLLMLSASATAQLQYLSGQGCALRLERDNTWSIIRLGPTELTGQESHAPIVTLATHPHLDHVLTQVVKLLAHESGSMQS